MNEELQTLVTHVRSLTFTVLKILGAWVFATLVLYFYLGDKLMDFYVNPIKDDIVLQFLKPTDGFFYYFKVYAFSGLVFSFPMMIYFVWRYVEPALKSVEAKFVSAYAAATMLFTSIAVIYGYIFLVPASLKFMLGIAPADITVSWSANYYLSFFFFLFLVLIIVFQTPIVVFTLVRTGLVSAEFFSRRRREIYFGVVAFMALISPTPDIMNLLLFSVPALVMLEGSLLVARFSLFRKSRKTGEVTVERPEINNSDESNLK